jgi:hypothetical protein
MAGGRSAKLKTFTLGVFGQMTVEQARRQAQIILADTKQGIDPAEERDCRRAEDRGAVTLAALVPEFLEIYGARLKPRSRVEYARNQRGRAAFATSPMSRSFRCI